MRPVRPEGLGRRRGGRAAGAGGKPAGRSRSAPRARGGTPRRGLHPAARPRLPKPGPRLGPAPPPRRSLPPLPPPRRRGKLRHTPLTPRPGPIGPPCSRGPIGRRGSKPKLPGSHWARAPSPALIGPRGRVLIGRGGEGPAIPSRPADIRGFSNRCPKGGAGPIRGAACGSHSEGGGSRQTRPHAGTGLMCACAAPRTPPREVSPRSRFAGGMRSCIQRGGPAPPAGLTAPPAPPRRPARPPRAVSPPPRARLPQGSRGGGR